MPMYAILRFPTGNNVPRDAPFGQPADGTLSEQALIAAIEQKRALLARRDAGDTTGATRRLATPGRI